MAQQKKCKGCGKVLRMGQSHNCPQQDGRSISYNDDSFLEILADLGAAVIDAVADIEFDFDID